MKIRATIIDKTQITHTHNIQNIEILQLLLNYNGIDVEKGLVKKYSNPMDITPLQNAAEKGHSVCVQYLLKHGARKNLKDALWKAITRGIFFS